MSIRQKLLILVLGAIVASLGSFGLYLATTSPAQQITEERGILEQVNMQLLSLELVAGDLYIGQFVPTVAKLEATLLEIDQAFELLRTVTRIPNLSEESKRAVEGILNLHEAHTKTAAVSLVENAKLAQIEMENNTLRGATIGTLELFDYIGQALNPPFENSVPVRFALRLMTNQYDQLKLSVTTARTLAGRQFATIDAEIERVLSSAWIITWLSIGVLIAAIFIVAFLVAGRIATPIKTMDKLLAVISTGDLRPVLEVKSRDEIGRLAVNMNTLMDSLRLSIGKILETSRRSLRLEDELHNAIEQASSASIEIEASITSISGQIEGIDAMVEQARASFDLMERTIADTGATVTAQNQQHHLAAGTINRVLDAVRTAGQLTSQTLESARIMVEAAKTGQTVFRQSHQKIAEITESVSSIRNLTKIISDISDRTNLLSMNAAIEAARAGESGKGFAVVANEIRNLATASAQSSHDISTTIEDVIQRITEADASREDTESAFDAINEKIQSASRLIEEMHEHIAKATQGSSEVLTVMHQLDESSRKSTEQSGRLTRGVEEFEQVIVHLQRVSSEVSANVGEISAGLGEIVEMVRHASQAVEAVGKAGKELDEIVQRFVVE